MHATKGTRARLLFVAPHTPSLWGHAELVQKTRGLGSGYWVRQGAAKSGVRDVVMLTTIWEPHFYRLNTGLPPMPAVHCRRAVRSASDANAAATRPPTRDRR